MVVDALLSSAASLRDDAEALAEGIVSEEAVDCVYNPLSYAWGVHEAYLRKAGGGGSNRLGRDDIEVMYRRLKIR